MTNHKLQKGRSKGKAGSKGEANHETVARSLAAILYTQSSSREARAIVNAAEDLGTAIGASEATDVRPEVRLRDLLDAHLSCAYEYEGQDGPKGKRAYNRLVTLAGGSGGLSDPATVNRVFKLQRDEPFTSGSYLCVGDIVNDLLTNADADDFSRDIFPLAFTLAARRVERKSGKIAPAAVKAYGELRDLLARLDAGETLEEIEQSERERYEREQDTRRAADLAKPEPKDKTSDAWRIWKLRQIEHAFGDERMKPEGKAAYTAAHNYFRDLLTGLYCCADFYRTDFILRLLPELIGIRQEIDEMYAYERRMRAGVKGAETREANKAKSAKKGGRANARQ